MIEIPDRAMRVALGFDFIAATFDEEAS